MQIRHAGFACLLLFSASAWSAVNAEEQCEADKVLLPTTPELASKSEPPPHPASRCAFYQGAWHTFLNATQPAEDGRPLLPTTYSTIEDSFGAPAATNFATTRARMLSLAPRNLQRPNEKLPVDQLSTAALSSGVNQDGPLCGLLIDQRGKLDQCWLPGLRELKVNPLKGHDPTCGEM